MATSVFGLARDGRPPENTSLDPGCPAAWLESSGHPPGLSHQLIHDGPPAQRLACVLYGRGAFRRFKDALADADGGLLARFHVFAEERQRGRARAWLAEQGYRPVARIP